MSLSSCLFIVTFLSTHSFIVFFIVVFLSLLVLLLFSFSGFVESSVQVYTVFVVHFTLKVSCPVTIKVVPW